jgi:tetratricopeptide (TPR) repeat protein
MILAILFTVFVATSFSAPEFQAPDGQESPTLAVAHRQEGKRSHDRGEWDRAISELEQAVALAPDDAAAHYLLGRAYSSKGYDAASQTERDAFLEKGAVALRRAVELDPRSIDTLNELGTVLSARDRQTEAVEIYRKALALQPNSATLHFNLADALVAMGEPELALAEYRWLFENPGTFRDQMHRLHNGMGRAYDFQTKLPEAEAEFKKALALDRDFLHAHINLANVYFQQRKLTEAIAEYQQAIRIQPDNPSHDYMVSQFYAMQRNSDSALEWLERAIKKGFDRTAAKNNNLFRRLADDPRFQKLVGAS